MKSSSNPRDCRDLKNKECEDLRAKSSSKTKIRRSVGDSGEKELQRYGRNMVRVRKLSKVMNFDIVAGEGLVTL